MKLAIMGDSHDYLSNLEEAIQIANKRECEYLLHTGDFIGPGAFTKVLKEFSGKVVAVFGNNDNNPMTGYFMNKNIDQLDFLGHAYDDEIGSVKIFMNHYPEVAAAVVKSDYYDLVIYGDDHTYNHKQVGSTTLLNPGTLNPNGVDFASFVIFDTETMEVEQIKL